MPTPGTGLYAVREAVIAYDDGNGGGVLAHECVVPSGLDPIQHDYSQNVTTNTERPATSRSVGAKAEQDIGIILRGLNGAAAMANTKPPWERILQASGFAVTATPARPSATVLLYQQGNTNLATDTVAGVTTPLDVKLSVDRRLWRTLQSGVFDGAFVLSPSDFPMIEVNGKFIIGLDHAVDAANPTNATETVPVAVGGLGITLTEIRDAVTGTATANGTTTLTDTARDFLRDGIQKGYVVENVTTSSTGGGVVTAVAQHALTITALTGGSPANITSGDEYSITPSPDPIDLSNCNPRTVRLPFGNNSRHRPDSSGTRSYKGARIIGRNIAVNTIDIDETIRSEYDWERAAEAMCLNDAHYYELDVTFNALGNVGNRFAFATTCKLVGKGGTLSGSVGDGLRRVLELESLTTALLALTLT